MSLQRWSEIVLAVALCAALSPLASADDGRPDRDTLSAMGLGSMVVMSDHEALAVRGQGYKPSHTTSSVMVFGNSQASIDGKNGGASSENGYLASGSHYAAGANGSFAGQTTITSGGKPGKPGGGYGGMPGGGYPGGMPGGGTTIKTTVFFAGGYSWGKAF